MRIPRQRVEFSVKALNFVKLLNKFNKENLDIFDITYRGDRVTFCSALNVKKKILAILEQSLYNEIETKTFSVVGFVKKQIYMIIGIFLFLALACLPNFVIYDVVVQCENNLVLDKIDNIMQEYNEPKIILQKDVDIENIRKTLFNIDGVSFCEVTIKGGRLYVFVKTELKPNIPTSKTQIRAVADGKITRISVTSGKAVVKVGDVVKKGDLLIDGKITVEGVVGEVATNARGKIYSREVFETTQVVLIEEVTATLENMLEEHLVQTKNSFVYSQDYQINEFDGKAEIIFRSDFEKVISEE